MSISVNPILSVAAVKAAGGGKLYFPLGVYRSTKYGLVARGISNLYIYFEPGAKLLMDNLNPQTKAGDHGHGVVISGPAE